MQIRKGIAAVLLGAGLVVGAGAIAPAFADVTIQQSNNAEDSDAQSGQSTTQNNSGAQSAGPQANGGGFVVQEGDNEVDGNQQASAKSGETVSGSQVTGVAAGGDQDVTINNSNVSEDADAESGSAGATNVSTLTSAGPAAAGGIILQDGDNEIGLDQVADASTGDAVAGGQVTGVSAF